MFVYHNIKFFTYHCEFLYIYHYFEAFSKFILIYFSSLLFFFPDGKILNQAEDNFTI